MTEILKVKGDWQEVVNDCRSTVGKGELGKEPSQAFKQGILIAEHSPIRDISIKWRWKGMKSWIATHWARHRWEKFITTQRTDRTGVPRDKLPQDSPVDFVGEANAQHLIDTMRKRLCRQAAEETRKYAEEFKQYLYPYEPELADVLVPNCVYRCGCPELTKCGFWWNFVDWCDVIHQKDPTAVSIAKRYELYNEYFLHVTDRKLLRMEHVKK